MNRTRLRILTGVVVAAVAALPAANPAWAEAAGLDVWNYAAWDSRLRDVEGEKDRLAAQCGTLTVRFRMNELLTEEVAAGRLSLSAATDRMWDGNRETPGYLALVRTRFPGATDRAKAARHVVYRVWVAPGLDLRAKAAALVRLEAEFVATFGAVPG